MKKAGKLLQSLLKKKIFYLLLPLPVLLGWLAFSVFSTPLAYAAPLCTTYQVCQSPRWNEGPHYIYDVSPTSLIAGRPDAVLEVRNCNLHAPSWPPNSGYNRYVLRKVGAVAGPDDIEADYGLEGGNLFLGFDLSGVDPGYYNFIHYYSKMTQCNPDAWDPGSDGFELPDIPFGPGEYHDVGSPPGDYSKVVYNGQILIYEPAIVGWGWFGAASPGDTSCHDLHGDPYPCGSPAWLSLNCLSDSIGGTSRNRCYDATENPTGVTYGLSLFYDLDHFNVRGQAWLGIHSDNDSNPANNTSIGWVHFDPTINPADPYDAAPVVPGTTATMARYNEDTGAVYGWARIRTLQKEGADTRCSETSRSWSLPISLLLSNNGAGFQIAEAPDRVLHGTWASPTSVYYDYYDGGSWLTSPVNLSDIAGDANNNTTPDIAIKSDGTVFVSYIHGGTDIRVLSCSADCTDPISWSFTNAVTGAVGLADQSLVVTKDTNRTLYVYYQQANDVYIVTSADGSAWSAAENISNSGNASQPRLAADFQDNVHVVWQAGTNVYYRKYTLGAGWEPALTEAGVQVNETGAGARPSIATDPEANPQIVYETAPFIVYRKQTPTVGWYPEVVISVGTNDTHPVIAVGNDYRAQVTYINETASPDKIEYVESTDGRTWTTPARVYDAGAANQSSQAVVVGKDNYTNVVFMQAGDVAQHTVSTGVYGSNCVPPNPPGDVSGTDWGWVSLRGGLGGYATPQLYADYLDTIGPGYRSCYACYETAKSCKICEILDQDYGAPSETVPPRYACNVCTKCGACDNDGSPCSSDAECGGTCVLNKKCSRTGADCDDTNPCDLTEGEENECVLACSTCDSCNLWGVSIDGDLATGANFHGYAWSAGGTVDIDASYPAGSYDSGIIDTAYNIQQPPGWSCNTRNDCRNGGWETANWNSNNFNTNLQFCNQNALYDGWGACQVRGVGAQTKFHTKGIPITQAGNYFISLNVIFDATNQENVIIEILDNETNGNVLSTLTSTDLNNVGQARKSCTFPDQVYLEPGNLLRFKSLNDVDIEIDSFQITSLPIYPLNCEQANPPLTEVYVDEVGFGFMDYSNVSMLEPWVQTQYGNIYSKGKIGPGGGAPAGVGYNSTYLIGTPDTVTIEGGWTVTVDPNYFRGGLETSFSLPSPGSSYRNPLGKIPYADLSKPAGANPYSDNVIEFNKDTSPACPINGSINWSQIKNIVLPPAGNGPLQKSVIHFGRRNEPCDLVVDVPMVFENGGQDESGAGTFLIEGDLIVNANTTYNSNGTIDVISQLASVAFIVKGDTKVKGSVTDMVGAYAVIGCEDLPLGNCHGNPADHQGLFDTSYDGDSSDQLRLSGVVLAARYDFGRTFSSTEGAELFTNDGTIQANPPPGAVNIATSTVITSVAPFVNP